MGFRGKTGHFRRFHLSAHAPYNAALDFRAGVPTRLRPYPAKENTPRPIPDMQRDPIPDFTDTELGIVQHDDIGECVMTLLQMQADHVARETARSS